MKTIYLKRRIFMSKQLRITLAISTFILCANLAQQSVDAPRQKPAINYKGVLTDNSGKSYNVENITISSSTRFEVYEKPASTQANPADHAIIIDLKDIASIKPTRALPTEGKQEYAIDPKDATRKQTYMEITIIETAPQKNSRDVLISAEKRIECEETTSHTPHKLAFEALNNLTLNQSDTHGETCDQAKKLSVQLEEVSHKDTCVIKSLQDWIHSWCNPK
jgi:hypothetical protein